MIQMHPLTKGFQKRLSTRLYLFLLIIFFFVQVQLRCLMEADDTDFERWESKQLDCPNTMSTIHLLSHKKDKVIKKTILLKSNNKMYAQQELRLMKQLKDAKCSYLVQYISHKISEDRRSIVLYMPYYVNGDLEQYLTRNKVPLQQRITMLIDVLIGLKALHARFVIHRDLKLKNIFVNQKGRCLVGDYGIAIKSMGPQASMVGSFPKAPQVNNSQTYNDMVDMWGVGIIAYQLLNPLVDGRVAQPFESHDSFDESRQAYNEFVKGLRDIRQMHESVPRILQDMIKAMLTLRPQDRLSWVSLYKNGYLKQFDTKLRLTGFAEDYMKILTTQNKMMQKQKFIHQSKFQFLLKLRFILNFKRCDDLRKKYPSIQVNWNDLHLFYYLLIREVQSVYKFMKDQKMYRFLKEYKPFMSALKEDVYMVEKQINNWMRSIGAPEINNNHDYNSPKKLAHVKEIARKVLQDIPDKQFDHEQFDDYMNHG